MRHFLRLLCVLILLPMCRLACARSHSEIQLDSLKSSHRIVYISDTDDTIPPEDSIRAVIDKFYYDQFRHFQDPAVPYFLFMSKDARLAMGIGGCVRMRGWYDWGGSIPSNGFVPALIPMDPAPTSMRKFSSTPAGSALFFKVVGRMRNYEYQLYIEANFNGYDNRDFHLKKAYATINDWTIGYASSSFGDPSALPPTVDAQGPNNKTSSTNVLLRWMHTYGKRWTVAVSMETPSQQMFQEDESTAKCDEWMPDFATFLQYEWSENQHVRIAGILRTMTYRDLIEGNNRNVIGWGVHLSSVCHPVDPVTVYTTLIGGRGISSLCGDMMVGHHDLVGINDQKGRLYAPLSLGWCVGLQYHFRPDIFVSGTFSRMGYFPDHTEPGTGFKYGLYGAANAFWNITPRIQVGAEFNIGKRKNFNGDHRWARRVGAMAQFSF